MRKIIVMVTLVSLFSCKKIERAFDPKYCWECSTLATGGVGDEETIRAVSAIAPCNMTTVEMFDFKSKATTYVNNNGSWAKTVTNCWRK